jgi:hypothetical protein
LTSTGNITFELDFSKENISTSDLGALFWVEKIVNISSSSAGDRNYINVTKTSNGKI